MKPLKPLFDWSEFVLFELPSFIVKVEKTKKNSPEREALKQSFLAQITWIYNERNLSNRINELIEKDSIELVGWHRRYTMKDLALIDLKFVDAMYYRLFGKRLSLIGDEITRLAKFLERPEILTYEELVMVNPMEDESVRIFSKDTRGESEKLFYRVHHQIEVFFEEAVQKLVEVRDLILTKGLSENKQEIQIVTDQKIQFGNVMRQVGVLMKNFDKELFQQFRPYISSYGQEGDTSFLPGPSGAYTSSIPNMELILAGDKSEKEYIQYLEGRFIFYPTIHRDLMKQLMNQDRPSLLTLSSQLDERLYEEVKSLSKDLKVFRETHLKLVEKKLPEALAKETASNFEATGGNKPPVEFLRNRIKRTPLE